MKTSTLAKQELEIMKIVWRLENATVRDVYETLRAQRKIAYTTVMTMMKILEKKKYLKKRVKDRAYVYQPARPKDQVIKSMLHEFVSPVFNGSAQLLLVHLVKHRELSEKDIQAIARMIRQSE